jgi:hypothetical protein
LSGLFLARIFLATHWPRRREPAGNGLGLALSYSPRPHTGTHIASRRAPNRRDVARFIRSRNFPVRELASAMLIDAKALCDAYQND